MSAHQLCLCIGPFTPAVLQHVRPLLGIRLRRGFEFGLRLTVGLDSAALAHSPQTTCSLLFDETESKAIPAGLFFPFFFFGQSWGVSNRICTVSNSTHAAFTWDSSLKWCSGGEMRHVVACMQGNRHRGAKQPSACCSDSVRWWWLLSVSSKHLPGKIYRGYLSKVIIHSKWKCHSLPHISKPKSLLMTLGGGDDSWMSPTKQPHPSFMNGSSL